jgi:glutamine cyclotransferase
MRGGKRLAVLAIFATAALALGGAGMWLALPAPLRAQTAAEAPPPPDGLPVVAAQVLRRFPHDTKAYTEGLFIEGGALFESTGVQGRSSLRRVDLASGRVLEQVNLPPAIFGEGIAPWMPATPHTTPNRAKPAPAQILMLSWRNGTGFRFARHGFRPLGHFAYLGEGWGLASNGHELIMSDGSPTLRFVNPANFRATRFLPVTASGQPVPMLNELEWVDGEILANVWLTDRIARIDPATGHVLGWIDVSALHREVGLTGDDQVPNGIAFDAAHGRLFVTGKEWPTLFEIRAPKR